MSDLNLAKLDNLERRAHANFIATDRNQLRAILDLLREMGELLAEMRRFLTHSPQEHLGTSQPHSCRCTQIMVQYEDLLAKYRKANGESDD